MYCLMCGKDKNGGSLKDVLLGDDPLCSSCRKKWRRINLAFTVDKVKAFAPYLYEENYAHCLVQYKECGDEALKEVFLFEVKKIIARRYRDYTLCLMPSSFTKERERGFSHLRMMCEDIALPILSPFAKEADVAQKQLTRSERQYMAHGIRIKEKTVLPEKLLLFDDTITTGSTIRGALSCLDHNAHKIKILVVSANKSWLPRRLNFYKHTIG